MLDIQVNIDKHPIPGIVPHSCLFLNSSSQPSSSFANNLYFLWLQLFLRTNHTPLKHSIPSWQCFFLTLILFWKIHMNAKLLNIYFKKMLYGIEHSHGKVMQKSKMAVWGGLLNPYLVKQKLRRIKMEPIQVQY